MVDPPALAIALHVNGESRRCVVAPWLTAVEFLRDVLGLTGTKVGCGVGECGACTVLVNGEPLLSCLLLVAELDGAALTTIEGLDAAGMSPLQQAFLRDAAYQCGFCTPGMIMAATAAPTAADDAAARAALAGNLCRCTGYTRIIQAAREGTPA